MRVSYALSCADSVRPEAEYALTTCLSTLGYFAEDGESIETGIRLFYGELPDKTLEGIRRGEWVVRVEHDGKAFRAMIDQGSPPESETTVAEDPATPVLGHLSGSPAGSVMREARARDGTRLPLTSLEGVGKGGIITIHFDLFAGVFFFLSRIEEVGLQELDQFGRFRQENVLCAAESFEQKPVVNIYMNILREALREAAMRSGACLVRKHEWPRGEGFCVSPTHDVDRLMRWRGRSILKGMLTGRVVQVLSSLRDRRKDPWWNLDTICRMERDASVRSTFFFFAQSGGSRGGRYDSQALRETLRGLAANGWETGLHGSYGSMLDQRRMKEERTRLGRALGSDVYGVRQHYLRVKVPESFKYMEGAGFKYDASIGFSDRLGFRASMCLPYRPFDFFSRKPLDLLEIPLVIMDGALPDSDEDRRRSMVELAGTVRRERGLFSILWHQRSFSEDDFPGIGSLYEWFLGKMADENARVAPHGEVFRWWQTREGVRMSGLERRDRILTASFSSPCDTPAMTFELTGRYRVPEADGVVVEEVSDRDDGHTILRLSNIRESGFKFVLEGTQDEQ